MRLPSTCARRTLHAATTDKLFLCEPGRGLRPTQTRVVVAVLLLASPVGRARAETRSVVAGPEYKRGGAWQFWFGKGYRGAWTTPVELPVLDLATEAGGLEPVRQIGGLQTVGLALAGKDGRSFTFRKLEKEMERVLPPDWRGSATATIVQDQTAAAHPAATVVVGALARSVGILFYRSRLVVMPDDPGLGEFRKTFGGTVGTFDEYITPGYDGISEIVSTSKLWSKWREGGPQNRVDSRAFLRARLFDLVTGNWDRHQGQWRWAHVPGTTEWEPLPEDADQAFTRYEGVITKLMASFRPGFMRYSGEYPGKLEGFTANNADVTRWFLADLEWPAFEQVAQDLKAAMTDAIVEQALRQMPPEWYAIDGAQLVKDLKQRRDHLPEYARRFYLHVSDRVDVRATDRDDVATVRHFNDGSLQVTLADAGGGEPYYQRRFLPKETQEVRLYLLGGNDRLVTTGPRYGGISLHVLGGAGNDMLDDSTGGADLRDSEGQNTFVRGPGTSVDERPYVNPVPDKERPWLEPRSYGHLTMPIVQLWWEPDQELMIGGGFTRTDWGFRKYPWAKMQDLTVLFSTGYDKFRANYSGEFRLTDRVLLGGLELRASGIENLNYYGLGNETKYLDKSVAQTQDYTLWAFPSLRIQPNRRFEAYLGGELKGIEPINGGGTFLEEEKPYGYGAFGEVGARTGFEFDSRGRASGANPSALLEPGYAALPQVSGVRVLADGFWVPKALDVTNTFGGVDGSVSGYLGNQKLSLALRTGGRKLWGPYPWFESASIGGSANLRGFDSNRFRGDASLYGNAELRYWLGRRERPVLPVRWGLFGFGETGRVWLAGEESKRWHTGYGGGLMMQLLGTPLVFTTALGGSDEGTHFYLKARYAF